MEKTWPTNNSLNKLPAVKPRVEIETVFIMQFPLLRRNDYPSKAWFRYQHARILDNTVRKFYNQRFPEAGQKKVLTEGNIKFIFQRLIEYRCLLHFFPQKTLALLKAHQHCFFSLRSQFKGRLILEKYKPAAYFSLVLALYSLNKESTSTEALAESISDLLDEQKHLLPLPPYMKHALAFICLEFHPNADLPEVKGAMLEQEFWAYDALCPNKELFKCEGRQRTDKSRCADSFSHPIR